MPPDCIAKGIFGCDDCDIKLLIGRGCEVVVGTEGEVLPMLNDCCCFIRTGEG